MKSARGPIVVLIGVALWFAALCAVHPFLRVNAALDRALGALPAWTQVERMHKDPATQELSRGENPLASFRILAQDWAARPRVPRVILMGNSQTQETSLARGEEPAAAPEKTYTDHLADAFRQSGSGVFYRLSAGALSYQEMLWYAFYLADHPDIKPDALLVQLNYQNFVNGGIRAGMSSLLADPVFRARIDAIIAANRPESGEFAEAARAYRSAQARPDATVNAASEGARQSAGYRIETFVRAGLEGVAPAIHERAALKQEFVGFLFRCRAYGLHMQASSKRSLGGARVNAARAALEDLVELCGRSGIRLLLFQAPTNPSSPLYASAEDDRAYHEYCAIAASHGATLLDFERVVPGPDWGMSLNAPDPLHMGRRAHRLFADAMWAALKQNGL